MYPTALGVVKWTPERQVRVNIYVYIFSMYVCKYIPIYIKLLWLSSFGDIQKKGEKRRKEAKLMYD